MIEALKKAWNAIFGNFRLKALALIISVGIWFYAHSRITQEINPSAPLEILPPDAYELLHQSADTVRIRMAGPRALVSRVENELARGMLRLQHKLRAGNLEDGWAELPIEGDWLRRGLTNSEFIQLDFRGVVPPTVRVFASPVKEKVLPVVVRTSELAPDRQLSRPPSADPPQVTVRGPAAALEALDAVYTEDFPLWNVHGTLTMPRRLRNTVEVRLAEDVAVPVELELSHSTAMATVHVSGEPRTEQAFEGVPILIAYPPGFPYEVSLEGPGSVSVVVRATEERLARLGAGDLAATVDLRTLSDEQIAVGATGLYAEPVRVFLPDEVALVRVDPPEVRLALKNPAR